MPLAALAQGAGSVLADAPLHKIGPLARRGATYLTHARSEHALNSLGRSKKDNIVLTRTVLRWPCGGSDKGRTVCVITLPAWQPPELFIVFGER